MSLPELQAGGNLVPEQHLYIERPEDAQLLELLERNEYCNVLSSRQVGKSSLVTRTSAALATRGYSVVIIDVAGTLGSPVSADEWYSGLLEEIARQIGVPIDVGRWWADAPQATPNQRLRRFFREILLPNTESGLVVFLDEIDHTLKFDYTDDFFTAIRSMYNDRAREPLYRRLAFCLVGVATPNELIKNRRTTAYNIGRTLELSDFDRKRNDLGVLVPLLSEEPTQGSAILDAVLSWTSGHPFLTVRLCEAFREQGGRSPEDVDRIALNAYRDIEHSGSDVHFQQITRFLAERLDDGPATLALYERVLNGHPERDKPTIYHAQLKLSGLVKRNDRGLLEVRNRIYARVFDLAWAERSQPRRTMERYRQSAVGAFVLLLAVAVYQVSIAPMRGAMADALSELRATSDEGVARARYSALRGEDLPIWLRWTAIGYADEADTAIRNFWRKRARMLEDRAFNALRAGRVEEALLLGAAAAVKTGGALPQRLADVYNASGLERLVASVVGLCDANQEQSILDGCYGRLLEDESALLVVPAELSLFPVRVVDMTTGSVVATHHIERGPRIRVLNDATGFFTVGRGKVSLVQLPTGAEIEQMALVVRHGLFMNLDTPGLAPPQITAARNLVGGLRECSRGLTQVDAVGFALAGTVAIADHGSILICDVNTHSRIAIASLPHEAPPRTRSINVVAVSPRGNYVYAEDSTAATDVRSDIYDARTGRHVYRASGFVQFSTDDGLFIVQDGSRATVVSTKDFKSIASLGFVLYPQIVQGNRLAIAVLPRGTLSPEGRDTVVVDIASGAGRATLGKGFVAFVSSSGHRVTVTDARGATFRVWDVSDLTDGTAMPRSAGSARDRWRQWQLKFGLTLNENDDAVPLAQRALEDPDVHRQGRTAPPITVHDIGGWEGPPLSPN